MNNYASECLTILSLTVFTQRKFVADFLQVMCTFRRKTAILRFWANFYWEGVASAQRTLFLLISISLESA